MQPGGFDLGQLMASAQRMQADMERAQASLAEARVTGSAGGGLVRAEVNGAGELLGLFIDPSVVDPAETLADLVVAAVRDGVRAANDMTREAMGSVAGDLMGGLTLPGMGDLPGFGGNDLSGAAGAILPGLPGMPSLGGDGSTGFDDDLDDDADDDDAYDDDDDDDDDADDDDADDDDADDADVLEDADAGARPDAPDADRASDRGAAHPDGG
jgi:DNA-binding YbaB/EbfC family protein